MRWLVILLSGTLGCDGVAGSTMPGTDSGVGGPDTTVGDGALLPDGRADGRTRPPPPPPPPPAGSPPQIADMGLHEVRLGEVFTYDPEITGDVVLCRKDLGHDDVSVDPVTGAVRWDTSALTYGRGHYIRIVCSNYAGLARASLVVHVDATGTSRLRVAGDEGVSPYIGTAARAMASGDTIVFPDGLYPVSVTRNESYENAFNSSRPTPGSARQLSTIIAQRPGGAVITGEAHDGIPTAKKAFQLDSPEYTAIVGFVVRDVLRESFTSSGGHHLLVEFLGTAGAGTNGRSCTNFREAADGWCSNAGFRINGASQVLVQNNYNWADNRYGIMLRSTSDSVIRRSLVRLDAYLGDQPYGAHSHYCTTNDLLQDSMALDSLAIAAPHYKNHAGIAAYPATGCENTPVNLATVGFLSLNNDLHLTTADSHANSTHRWDHTVVWDTEGTRTPQAGRSSVAIAQGDQPQLWSFATIGRARGFDGGDAGRFFAGEIEIHNASLQDLTAGTLGAALVNSNTLNVAGLPNQLDLFDSVRYLPRAEPGAPLEGQVADLLYHTGRTDVWYGEPGYEMETRSRRWPIAGEDLIEAQLRAYDNPNALAVGGGTVHVRGDRGAAATGETLSEYVWGYIDPHIPPLVVRVTNEGEFHRVAWEHHRSSRRESVTGWRVWCMDEDRTALAELAENVLAYHDMSGCGAYAVTALYGAEESGVGYVETPQ